MNAETRTRRIGILGGTFDPIHRGHLVIARAASEQLALDRVLFVPVGQPPHRSEKPLSESFHREAMISLAIAREELFDLSRADLDRPGPHYTADLLEILHHTYPGARLYFLMGGDSLSQFLTWYQPERILAQAKVGVLHRPGWQADMEDLKRELPEIRQRLVWLEGPAMDISGTEVRQRIREGRSISGLVLPKVEDYIYRHCLYHEDREKERVYRDLFRRRR